MRATICRLTVSLLVTGLVLAGCAGGGGSHNTARKVPITPGVYKVGSPYRVNGVWYRPQEDPNYLAVGEASWYGDAFHGKRTANGETFDMTRLTAAHPTLPLPSYVLVTNLENGRQTKVRVNDRGPFAKGRIIDLSRAAADQLGFRGKGIAKVRVQYVGRAPLDEFYIEKAVTHEDEKQVAAKPVTSVDSGNLSTVSGTTAAPAVSAPRSVPAYTPAPSVSAPTPPPSYAPPPQQPVAATTPRADPVGELIASLPQTDAGTAGKPLIEEAGRPGLYVQAGSYLKLQQAETLRNQVASMAQPGETVGVKLQTKNNLTWYLVRFGPLGDTERAQWLLSGLLRAGHSSAVIVVD